MSKKSFTIKDAFLTDIEFVKRVQKESDLDNNAAALHKIIIENQSKPQGSQAVNIKETEVYKSLLSANQALTLQVEEQVTAISGLQTENQSLLIVNRELTQEKEKLQNEEVNLKENDFVFSPDAELYKKMRRVLAYLIKNGSLKKDELNFPQRLTRVALEKLIENDYSNILK